MTGVGVSDWGLMRAMVCGHAKCITGTNTISSSGLRNGYGGHGVKAGKLGELFCFPLYIRSEMFFILYLSS